MFLLFGLMLVLQSASRPARPKKKKKKERKKRNKERKKERALSLGRKEVLLAVRHDLECCWFPKRRLRAADHSFNDSKTSANSTPKLVIYYH
ncbi:hypothetical protein IWZ01DRAFT_44413 [Phyllosticta capitalensis]